MSRPITQNGRLAWCMFFSAVKGWQYHPGTGPGAKLSTKECASIADDMLDEYLTREEQQWDGWPPHR